MNKLLKAALAFLLIGSPVLTTVACRKPIIGDKIIDDRSTNKTTLNEYVEKSSHIAKAVILAEQHKFDLQTTIANNINFAKNNDGLKEQLKPFFNENYENLFKDENLLSKFSENNQTPITNLKNNENGLLSLINLLLITIAKDNKVPDEKDKFALDFLGRNISEVLNQYKQSEYKKLITLFQEKITEHDKFIKEKKTYSDVLKWSVDNIRRKLIMMSKGEDNKQNPSDLKDNDLDKKYEALMKKLFQLRIFSQNIDPTIKSNLLEAIKKPENIINLIIWTLPIVSYILNTFDKFPQDFNVNNIWSSDGEFLKDDMGQRIEGIFTNQLASMYKGIEVTNITSMVKKIKEILSLENDGLSIRKLLLTFYRTPSIKKLFDGIEIKVPLSSPSKLKDLALGSGYIVNFKNIFERIKELLEKEKTLTNLFGKLDKHLENLDSLLPDPFNNLIKLTSLEVNIQQALFFIEDLTKKLTDVVSDENIELLIKAKSISNVNFLETLQKLLNKKEDSKGVKKLEDIVNENEIQKINKTVWPFYKLLIAKFGTNEVVKLINKNDEIIKEIYHQEYLDSRLWNISNAELTETKINRIISYDISYENKGVIRTFNLKFETADLKNNKLQIVSFENKSK